MKKIILIMLAFLGINTAIMAQSIEVKSFKRMDNDLAARVNTRYDNNEDPCALIKIITVGTDFNFEGNVVGDPIYRKGEVWVYMSEGSSFIKVSHAEYGFIRFDMPERIEKQTVYELNLSLIESTLKKTRAVIMPAFNYNPSQGSFGLMVGFVKKAGLYAKVVSDFNFISVEDKGDDLSNQWLTGNTQTSRLAITGGVLLRLAPVLYTYAGCGYGYRKYAAETSSGEYLTVSSTTYDSFEAELGLMLRLKNIGISIGAQSNGFNYIEGTVGVGFMF